jgi:hypothetical protein
MADEKKLRRLVRQLEDENRKLVSTLSLKDETISSLREWQARVVTTFDLWRWPLVRVSKVRRILEGR